MRTLSSLMLLSAIAFAQPASDQIPADDAVRIREFYRLASQIQDQVWPSWNQAPASLLLITQDKEFLTHYPDPPKDFKPVGDSFYSRSRQFPTSLLATFPAFGPPAVIVIGEPKNTSSKTSTPWIITLMHEHFHQLQDSQPGYFPAVEDLGLSHGDSTGMWMLNYPFPYKKPEIGQAFSKLRDLLLSALSETDGDKFEKLAKQYVEARRSFFSKLSPEDKKYFSFQLWQEGIARYTQIKSAEAAEKYEPTADYKALPDYEPFASYGAKARTETLDELKKADLAEWKRTVVYSFGAAEGLLLDRLHPAWKREYFKNQLSMEAFFEN
ncbi:MAG: hypothetical protein LAO03_23315 [Acidobacteriia bacterium]|nr:hypothetical protein [Terriglobia bacterium]